MTKRVNGSLDFYHLWVDHKSVIKDYKNLIWGSVLDGSFQPKG